MILLDFHNVLLENTLHAKADALKAGGKPEVLALQGVDFDGVTFDITSTAEARTLVIVGITWAAANLLLQNGGKEYLEKTYGSISCAPPKSAAFAIQFDITAPPEPADQFFHKVALMKRNLFAGPFVQFFDAAAAKKTLSQLEIPYSSSESCYLKLAGDRIIVIFSVNFKDPDDVIYGKVFVAAYSKALSGAPIANCTFGEPPAELEGAARNNPANAYVSFVLEQRHYSPQKRDAVLNLLPLFRNHLHYHIKCNKANLHMRMRTRVGSLLQILNRAKNEPPKKKTLASGRTFTRK